jgi:hypothetical protein
MTPQERQYINALLEAASISGASLEAAVRSICEEMLYLTPTEVAEACHVHAEELRLNGAVSSGTHRPPASSNQR